MTCKCEPCQECNGSGHVWFAFGGQYLGRHRCDDMDELETCPECHGSGISEMCDECTEKEASAEWEAAEQCLHLDAATPAKADITCPHCGNLIQFTVLASPRQ